MFRAAVEFGISWQQLIDRIVNSEPDVAEVVPRANALVQIRVPGVVFLLLWRCFRWAVTDLCRFRLTAAIGYQRQQAEAVAVYWLFRDDPEFANRWITLESDDEGRRFHRDVQRRLCDIMRQHGLYDIYQKGSATAMHIRFAGACRGLRQIVGGVPTLLDAEMDPDDLYEYHSVVAEFLRTQQLVFRAMDPANNEREFELPRLTREAFDQHLEIVSAQLQRKYTNRGPTR